MTAIKYTEKELYFEYKNFTEIDSDTCRVFLLSSNTVMLCLAFLTHYGKWRNRYAVDLEEINPKRITDSEFSDITSIVDKAIGEIMSDCDMSKGIKSLQEIEFTLKEFLTLLSDSPNIKYFHNRPIDPQIDPLTNEFVVGDNPTIDSTLLSVFKADSLLSTSNITEILQTAFLNDGTIQLPDINPFNLESKVDTLNYLLQQELDEIDIKLDLANQNLNYLWKPFYAGVDINPLLDETIFGLMRRSFNLKGLLSDKAWLEYINTNIASSFNATVTDHIATNSHFKSLDNWLTMQWLRFYDVMEYMRICICSISSTLVNGNGIGIAQLVDNGLDSIKSSIDAKDATVTVNVPDSPVPMVNVTTDCCDDTGDGNNSNNNSSNSNPPANSDIKQLLQNISDGLGDITNALKNDGNADTTTVTDNGDGTYTVSSEGKVLTPTKSTVCDNTQNEGNIHTNNTVNYPSQPNYNTNPYMTKRLLQSSCNDAKCGYIYKMMTDTADSIDEILNYAEPLADILIAMGYTVTDIIAWGTTVASALSLIATGGADAPVVAGVNLVKAGGVILAKDITKTVITALVIHVGADLGRALAQSIRVRANAVACGYISSADKVFFMSVLKGSEVATSEFSPVMYHLGSLIWDYKNASDTVSTLVNMNDYAEFCPCILGCECMPPYVITLVNDFYNPVDSVITEGKIPKTGTAYYSYTVTINLDTQLKTCLSGIHVDWCGSTPSIHPVPLYDGNNWNTGGTLFINQSPSNVNGHRLTVENYALGNGFITLTLGSIRLLGQSGNYLRISRIDLGEHVS